VLTLLAGLLPNPQLETAVLSVWWVESISLPLITLISSSSDFYHTLAALMLLPYTTSFLTLLELLQGSVFFI